MSGPTTQPSGGAGRPPAGGSVRSRLRNPLPPAAPERAFRFSPRTLGAALGLFALGYLVLAFQVPDYTAVNVPVQPSTLPRWLGVVLLALAVLLFFQRVPEEEAPAGPAAGPAPGSGDASPAPAEASESADGGAEGARLGRLDDPRLETGLFVAALCGYVALFEPLGFVLSTALYLGSMTWYLGYRRHLATAAVALGLPLALYAGMTWGLSVALPSGPLPF